MKTYQWMMLFFAVIVFIVTLVYVIKNGPQIGRYFLRLPAFAILYYGGSS